MYAADHIRRVLRTFPGVFTGIGEFTIHKEFVSSKVAGEVASLTDPALDSILSLAGQAGLVVILHNDLDVPFAKAGQAPVFLEQIQSLFRRHPDATIIWAHVGLGRVVHPVMSGGAAPGERPPAMLTLVQGLLDDPGLRHVSFDISWDEVAKYVVATPQSLQNTASIINQYPDRFLFGTDNVAPTEQAKHLGVYDMYQPLWNALTPEASAKVRKGNYERLFDGARKRVRAWEKANAR
jgi:predicted TIM-barrel fold metal-dependent hydrolase